MISCKEATELMSQEKDRPLGLAERIGLRVHVLFCRGCTNYRRQMDVLSAACRRLSGRDDK
jgi:hypothetical protein